MVANIDPEELKDISKNFRVKPKFAGLSSLEEAQKQVNFGVPQINVNEKERDIDSLQVTDRKKPAIKINLTSPTIKKDIDTSTNTEKKLIQETDVEKLVSEGGFSADSLSFVPDGAGFITAKDALKKIEKHKDKFASLQDNYLTGQNIEFIISKIDKIYDLSDLQKTMLREFYQHILKNKKTAKLKREKASEYLHKIKQKQFRENISYELQRMMKPNGDLYKYYTAFELIDEEFKKRYINRILSIDAYILKKMRQLMEYNQNDLLFGYDEILEFVAVLDTRNLIMENFHQQVESLALQKKQIDSMKQEVSSLESKILSIAQTYGKSGKYGNMINKSSGITQKLKKSYFNNISECINQPMNQVQQIALMLNTENYTSIDLVKQKINTINISSIENKCLAIYDKINKQTIK